MADSSQTLIDLINKGPGGSGPTSPTSQTTQYIGNVPHARIQGTPIAYHAPFVGTAQTSPGMVPGYKKGDQFALLPTNGQDLATLQQALVQAGYLSADKVIYGSPDQLTIGAFEKLLTTANLSGVSWQNALSSRLAAAAQQPPASSTKQPPPLTITLDNPDDIKAVAQSTAQTLYGGNLPDADLNNLVTSYQGMQRAAQTQAYNQQYDPAAGTYGPGGETTTPESVKTMTENLVKTQHPEQYQATQIGASLTKALDSLRNTGYL